MVKSIFNDLGVAGLLMMRATVFILGVRGHLVEKVAKKLGFFYLPTVILREKSIVRIDEPRKCLSGFD